MGRDVNDTPPSDRIWWRCSLTDEALRMRNAVALATGKPGHEPKSLVLLAFSQTAYRAWMAARVWFQCELGELDVVPAANGKIGGPDFKGKDTKRGLVAGVLCVWPEEFPKRARRKR